MRILYVIDCLGGAGAERSTAELMIAMRGRGHTVSAATLYDSASGEEHGLRRLGLNIDIIPSGSFEKRSRALREIIRNFQPDVVHTAMWRSDQLGRVAAVGTGAAVVSSLVSTPYDEGRFLDGNVSRWKVRLAQLCDSITARRVARFHAVSVGVATANARALHVSPRRVEVANRGRSRADLGEWSTERRSAVRRKLGIDERASVIVSLGRQDHQKRHVDLLKAIGELIERVPDLVVLHAGRSGNASPAVAALLESSPRVAGAVRLLGYRRDAADLICAADVLAISSSHEGTAGVALEAMALRTPVVCTDVTGVEGVLQHEHNALLVPIGDSMALANSLYRSLRDSDLRSRLISNGLADYELRFTIDAAVDAMQGLYRRALG